MNDDQIPRVPWGFCFRPVVPGEPGLARRLCTGEPRVLTPRGLVLFYAGRAEVPITFDGVSVKVLDVRRKNDVDVVQYIVGGSERIEELRKILRQGSGVNIQFSA